MNKIIREPLIHFLLIGALLFLVYSNINDSLPQEDNQITITQTEIDNINSKFIKAKGREPSKEEASKLLEDYIKEEVLFKEALSKGLNKNDNTIKLHLAKKMQYVLDDLSVVPAPSEDDLKNFLKNNTNLFKESGSISFNQVVFTKTEDIQEANTFLKRLKSSKSSKKSTIGKKVELDQKSIKKIFGTEFAKKIFSLPLHTWQGPIKTKHGLHLVFIHSKSDGKVPELSKIKDRVKYQYKKKKQEELNKKFYNNLAKRYEIIIQDKKQI